MEKINTIQKRENLNHIYAIDEKGNGGANHKYQIVDIVEDANFPVEILSTIQFQNGARADVNNTRGVLDTDLLEIVRHRLQCFQAGPFSSAYNEKALEHLELCLMYMNRRVEDRIERNVLDTYT